MHTEELKMPVTEEAKAEEASIDKFIATYYIPDAKAEAVTLYIIEMRRKFPTMKGERILRKTAEYFNLKKK